MANSTTEEIFVSSHFIVLAPKQAHVTRQDGGHIVIVPKAAVKHRVDLSPMQAREVMWLTCLVGKAMMTVLPRLGVDIGRINYQDNGNWHESFHIHLYGRAYSAVIQKYGQALYFPPSDSDFYQHNESLTCTDIQHIQAEIALLLKIPQFMPDQWC